jgi:hexokinase
VLQTGKMSGDEPIDIGVDGSLVEHYPYFRNTIDEALRAIDGIGKEGADRIRIGIAKDGSGVGAALIALVAAGMEKHQSAAEYLNELRTSGKSDLSVVPEDSEAVSV